MKIVEKNKRYELIVNENAVFEDYENIINYLMRELNLMNIKEVDDFDTHYQLFNYNSNIIVIYYNNFLGLSIYFDDRNIDNRVQQKVLTEFLEVLKKATS
jgi:hypothetical protein